MENCCCCCLVVVEESLRFCDDVGGVGVDLVGVRAMLGDDVVGCCCCWSEKATNVVLFVFVFVLLLLLLLLLFIQVVVLDIC